MSSYRLESNLPKVMGMFEQNKRKALDAVGLETSGRAKEITPVDTGRLRSSITWQKRDTSVDIGTNVEYAIFVHEDLDAFHRTGEAKFLTKAVTRHEDRIRHLIKAGMEGKL